MSMAIARQFQEPGLVLKRNVPTISVSKFSRKLRHEEKHQVKDSAFVKLWILKAHPFLLPTVESDLIEAWDLLNESAERQEQEHGL